MTAQCDDPFRAKSFRGDDRTQPHRAVTDHRDGVATFNLGAHRGVLARSHDV